MMEKKKQTGTMRRSKAESKGRDKRKPREEKDSWDVTLRQIKRNKKETKRKRISGGKGTGEKEMTEKS